MTTDKLSPGHTCVDRQHLPCDACEQDVSQSVAEYMMERVSDHSKDEDCSVDPATGACSICNVVHGDPCPDCGGRAFHKTGCIILLAGFVGPEVRLVPGFER